MTSNWISVKDRLPEYKTRVLAYLDNNTVITAELHKDKFKKEDSHWYIPNNAIYLKESTIVTHWQELIHPIEETVELTIKLKGTYNGFYTLWVLKEADHSSLQDYWRVLETAVDTLNDWEVDHAERNSS